MRPWQRVCSAVEAIISTVCTVGGGLSPVGWRDICRTVGSHRGGCKHSGGLSCSTLQITVEEYLQFNEEGKGAIMQYSGGGYGKRCAFLLISSLRKTRWIASLTKTIYQCLQNVILCIQMRGSNEGLLNSILNQVHITCSHSTRLNPVCVVSQGILENA